MGTPDLWEYKAIMATRFWSDGYNVRGEGDISLPQEDNRSAGRGHGFRHYYDYSTKTLNSLGKEGWELISATLTAEHSHDYYFIFKRKL